MPSVQVERTKELCNAQVGQTQPLDKRSLGMGKLKDHLSRLSTPSCKLYVKIAPSFPSYTSKLHMFFGTFVKRMIIDVVHLQIFDELQNLLSQTMRTVWSCWTA